jgi:hypothetical protein
MKDYQVTRVGEATCRIVPGEIDIEHAYLGSY